MEEELERIAEAEKQQAAGGTATPKSGSAVVNEPRSEEKVDKSWVKAKEERAPSSGTSRFGLVDVDAEEEGKYSSGSKPEKRKERERSLRRRSSRRSRSRRRSHRSHSRRDRRRPRPTSSDAEKKAPKKDAEAGKEKKAKPSVRPPRTPSRSPPKPKPPKRLPVAKAKQRPTGGYWQGPARGWKLDPSYYGVKKRERHYQGGQGGR